MLFAGDEEVEPENFAIRLARKFYPVSTHLTVRSFLRNWMVAGRFLAGTLPDQHG